MDHHERQPASSALSLLALVNRARTRHPGDEEQAGVYLAELVTAQGDGGDTAGELCRLAVTLTAAARHLPALSHP